MNVVKVLFVIGLGASCCLTKFINESSKTGEFAKLGAATVNILLTCHETRWNTVGVAGILESSLFEPLSSQQSFAVTLIDNETYNNRPFTRGSRHKLQLFLVTASTADQLNTTLRHVKNSLWWNHMATFLIVDWQSTSSKDTCSNAYDYMWTSWQMNLLKLTYLCVHKTRGILIYTFNPFSQNAPEPWHLENTYKGKNEHPWTMFSREYDIDDEICQNLEFEKTNDLAGYEILGTVAEIAPDWTQDSKKHLILDSSNEPDITAIRYLFHALNGSVRLQVPADVQRSDSFGTKGNDMAMDTLDGGSDILLDSRFHISLLNYTFSSPFYENAFNIVTQYRGQQSQLQKLLTVLDSNSRIGLCLVALTVLIFFKFLRRQTLGQAILNTLRIFTNSSLAKVPTNQGARIFLACVFFLVVTIVGIYQGLLASLLTKSKPLKNVETFDDLAKSEYTIHSHRVVASLFTAPEFKNRFIGHDDGFCLKLVLNDPSIACVGTRDSVFEPAAKNNLHIARELVDKKLLFFPIREDWPLEERFNKILEAMVNADIFARVYDGGWKKWSSKIEFYKFMAKNQKPKVMTLNDLMFAIVTLGIGLSIATVVFFVEVAIFSVIPKIQYMWSNIRSRV